MTRHSRIISEFPGRSAVRLALQFRRRDADGSGRDDRDPWNVGVSDFTDGIFYPRHPWLCFSQSCGVDGRRDEYPAGD